VEVSDLSGVSGVSPACYGEVTDLLRGSYEEAAVVEFSLDTTIGWIVCTMLVWCRDVHGSGQPAGRVWSGRKFWIVKF